MYEILRFQATKLADPEEYRAFRLDVKRRLNIPYQVLLANSIATLLKVLL